MLDDTEKIIADALEGMDNKKAALEKEYLKITARQLEINAELSSLEASSLRAKSRIGYIPEVKGAPNCINCFILHGSNVPLSEIESEDQDTELFKCNECGHVYNNTP